jgi:hypothetical protein
MSSSQNANKETKQSQRQEDREFRSVREAMPNEVDKRRIKVKDSRASGGTTWVTANWVTHCDANPEQKSPPSAWATLTRHQSILIGSCWASGGDELYWIRLRLNLILISSDLYVVAA